MNASLANYKTEDKWDNLVALGRSRLSRYSGHFILISLLRIFCILLTVVFATSFFRWTCTLVSSHIAKSEISWQPQKNCFMCKSFKCNDFSFGKVISSFQSKDMNEKDNLIVAAIQKYWFTPYLIFVTDTRTVSVEKKSVMWRNFKFLYMTDVEKSKILPQVD